MKYVIIVPDGAADYPLARLEGKTPLEAARTPNMDRAASEGLLGITCHVPPHMNPGSEVAIMSLMGYDPAEYFTGRGPLEAADLGIEMGPHDWAFRCNLVTVADGLLADFTAGHISSEEAAALLEALNARLGNQAVSFHPGMGYRHVMMYRGQEAFNVETIAPHDVVGQPLAGNVPSGSGSEVLNWLMRESAPVLAAHDVNKVRVDLGRNPANMIWLWSPGQKPRLHDFEALFHVRGAVISAVNLVRGLGRLAGWQVIMVPGATGYTDTDYGAKGRYAVDALTRFDLVMVHVEASDEASHDRDLKAKVRALEQIDKEVVGPLMAQAEAEGGTRVLIVPDHVTSVEDGRHKRDSVPFAIWGEGVQAASGHPYSEPAAAANEVEVPAGHDLMEEFLGVHPRREEG
jgi:2,3-bisphosphoglycerate-independent phosphoglycerate mutase